MTLRSETGGSTATRGTLPGEHTGDPSALPAPPDPEFDHLPPDFKVFLDGAVDIMRGPVEPGSYGQFIFPLLFLKWLSDTWDEEQAARAKTEEDR